MKFQITPSRRHITESSQGIENTDILSGHNMTTKEREKDSDVCAYGSIEVEE